jgi:hypothetical protein
VTGVQTSADAAIVIATSTFLAVLVIVGITCAGYSIYRLVRGGTW